MNRDLTGIIVRSSKPVKGSAEPDIGDVGDIVRTVYKPEAPGVGAFWRQVARKVGIRFSGVFGGARWASRASASGPCAASQCNRALEILDPVGGLTLSSAHDSTSANFAPTLAKA